MLPVHNSSIIILDQITSPIPKHHEPVLPPPQHASTPRARRERCSRIDAGPEHGEEVEGPDGVGLVRLGEVGAAYYEMCAEDVGGWKAQARGLGR